MGHRLHLLPAASVPNDGLHNSGSPKDMRGVLTLRHKAMCEGLSSRAGAAAAVRAFVPAIQEAAVGLQNDRLEFEDAISGEISNQGSIQGKLCPLFLSPLLTC